MDGRVQLPVIQYLMERYTIQYVDSITEAGPVRFFVGEGDRHVFDDILDRINISVNKHGSHLIALCSHAGCAGNPAPDDVQKDQLQQAVPFLKKQYPECDVIGLWIGQTDDDNWDVQQLL
jgi:hypothetical protein